MLHPIFNATRDHYQGDLFAPVELLIYSDLQSTAYAETYCIIKRLMSDMGSDLRFVLRHFPTPDKNPLSLEAAIASEIAASHGRFWEMHDIIIENQHSLVRAIFPYFASAVGVDMLLFEEGRKQKHAFHKIINDYESGNRSGVDTAPSIFINGKKYNGLLNYAALYRTCKYALTTKHIIA